MKPENNKNVNTTNSTQSRIFTGKKIFLVVTTIIIVFVGYKYFTKTDNNNIPHSEQAWENKYPQVFTNVGYSKLVTAGKIELKEEIKTDKELTLKEQVIGAITNKFGIGDDMLAYIMKTIPATNESAVYAAIRFAQLRQKVFLSENQEDAIMNMKKAGIGVDCLDTIYGTRLTHRFIKEADQLMTNTSLRLAQEYKVRNFLAWQLIGNPDLSMQDENKMCINGDY